MSFWIPLCPDIFSISGNCICGHNGDYAYTKRHSFGLDRPLQEQVNADEGKEPGNAMKDEGFGITLH